MASTAVGGLFPTGTAFAAVPTITGPARVYMNPDQTTSLAFTGVELIAAPQSKLVTVDVDDNLNTCDPGALPSPVYTGCAHVQLSVGHGLLKLTMDPGMSTAGDPVAGGAALQFSGTKAQLNAALATMTFTPDSGYTNLADTPAILTINATNGLTPFESTTSGSPDKSKSIEIRVAKLNGFPTMTDPSSPQPVAASSATTFPGNAFNASDPDVDSLGVHGNMLFIAWVTCGTFDISPSGNFHLGSDIKDLLTNFGGIDATVVDTVYGLLPDSVKNLQLETATSGVKAIAGVGTLIDVNDAYSTVTFHSPALPSTCTMTNFLSDLGNHGLPGHYFNTTMTPGQLPTGVELPALGFSTPTPAVTFIVAGGAVPAVTIEQAVAQSDPTSASPIHFTATFDTDVTGFDPADVALSGTAGASTAVVSGGPSVYDVAVSGMTQTGTVIANIPAGGATAVIDPQNTNAASTSVDNSVTYNTAAVVPSVTVEQGAAQSDPTSSSPVVFDVVFSESVTGFDASDVVLGGTAGASSVLVSGSGAVYSVSVSGMSVSGTVTATVGAGAAVNAGLTASAASTSVDNTVTYNTGGQTPLTLSVPPDKSVPNDPGMAGAVVTFAAATAAGGVAPVSVSCSHLSGDFFVLGPTVVTCTATDSSLASQQHSFVVTVVDNEAPTISHPSIVVHTNDPAGTVVIYGAATAADNSGVAPTVTCTPATGINFVAGTTPVTCTATDGANNTASVTFNVVVILDPAPSTTTTVPASAANPPAATTTVPASGANPPSTTTSVAFAGGVLPVTGSDSSRSLGLAALAAALGFGLVKIARRPRRRA